MADTNRFNAARKARMALAHPMAAR